MAVRSGLLLRKDTLIYPTFKCLGCPHLLSQEQSVRPHEVGLTFGLPLLRYVLPLYQIQLTYPVVLPIRQCTFPYGYQAISHHIGHIIRGLVETCHEHRELCSQDRTRTCFNLNWQASTLGSHVRLSQFRHLTVEDEKSSVL